MAAAVGLIFAGTAVPEEILFRALIQNLLTLRFGAGWRTPSPPAVIFGAPTWITGRSRSPTGAI